MIHDLNDEQLVILVQDLNHAAFEVLVQRHYRYFFRLAYRQIFDQPAAEDIVQDCYFRFWQKPKLFNVALGSRFVHWFSRVVINASRDMLRKKRTLSLDDEHLNYVTRLDDNHVKCSHQQALHQALLSLPERQRSAVNLCYYEEYKNQEAAEIMGVSLKALESLLMRAKAKLRFLMKEKAP